MPFAGYTDHDDCVSKNRDKGDPDAYCATIERKVKEGKKVLEVERLTKNAFVPKTNALIEPGKTSFIDQYGEVEDYEII